MTRALSAFSLVCLLAIAAPAAAQEVGHVALADLTVDGSPPPEIYRAMFSGAVEPTLAPILECYRQRLAQQSGIRGNLQLRLWISNREVIRATPEVSLPDAELQTCAIARVRELRLPDVAPTGGAAVRFVLQFTTTGTPLPATQTTTTTTTTTAVTTVAPPVMPPRASISVDSVRGGLGADLVATAIPLTSFDACPAGVGTVPFTLSITRRGTLRATMGRGTLRDRAVRTCMLTAVRALSMPTAGRATTATITVTLSR